MGEGKPATSNGVPEELPHESIRGALHRVLQSQGFRSSRRSQDFLRYVVERTLEGQAESLKERTIGIDVFGRTAEYDPSDDATVRVKAGEVRKRLSLYYANEGQADEIRIGLPAGTYVPEFHAGAAESKPVPETVTAGPPRRSLARAGGAPVRARSPPAGSVPNPTGRTPAGQLLAPLPPRANP